VQLLQERLHNPQPPAPRLSPAQRWQRARELAQMMRRARQRRDWAAYGLTEKQLMELLEK
jgi:hypothetical protein